MRTIAVIPARFQSQRLPGKPLVDLHGKTMVERVYERVRAAKSVDDVLVATDDERILIAVERFGGNAVMTSSTHRSGSDRIAEAVADLDADTIVNVQGDEPLLSPQAIEQALDARTSDVGGTASMVSLMRLIDEPARIQDPNVVKVVTDARGYALYFSRAPIPYGKPANGNGARSHPRYFEHIGLYVYPKSVLLRFVSLEQTELERVEKLEQLRALAHGIPIRMVETEYESLSVDTPEDLERVRAQIAALESDSESASSSPKTSATPPSVSTAGRATLPQESRPVDAKFHYQPNEFS